jgi:hypothetical protein
MAKRKIDYCYLKVNIQGSEPRKYPSLEEALAAIKDLLHLQSGRGFLTIREANGRHISRHPDGREVQFWAENAQGQVVS